EHLDARQHQPTRQGRAHAEGLAPAEALAQVTAMALSRTDRLEMALDCLGQAPRTSRQLAEQLGVSQGAAGDYLLHLRRRDLVEIIPGTMPQVYRRLARVPIKAMPLRYARTMPALEPGSLDAFMRAMVRVQPGQQGAA